MSENQANDSGYHDRRRRRSDVALVVARRALRKAEQMAERMREIERSVDRHQAVLEGLRRSVEANTAMAEEGRQAAVDTKHAMTLFRASIGWKIVGAIATLGTTLALLLWTTFQSQVIEWVFG